ncbi:MAG TPA: AI-2E family transporter [Stellaceae bacterium]|jgi:predicted PurR-regulated permease PerM|nr:AI-2E family transporter [Stellaceae bacterium]
MGCDGDPREEAQDIEPGSWASAQRVSRVVLATALGALGLWIVHRFLPALAWATILAIALWPLYLRAEQAFPPRGHRIGLALAATLLVGLVLIVPLVYAAVEVAHESGSLVRYIGELRHTGLPTPSWLVHFPGLGYPLAEWWRANLNDPQTMQELLGRLYTHVPAASARAIGVEVVHRLVIFGFTLLTLFFLFRDGEALCRQLLLLSQRMLGPSGERVARHMIAAVHGTVTGLVLVGLAEGVLLGFAYALAGLPHAVPVAALTGVLAVIPFGAPIAFCAAGLYLLANSDTGAAIGVVAFGFLVVFVADHFVRPVLIGGAARLPFLWVLLGILGGLETFGLLGLFLGPVVMAALMSLWRDWTERGDSEPPAAAVPRQRFRR